MNKSLTIVIVTYNSRHLIEDCLASIFRYNDLGDSLNVVVVDNDSPQQNETFEFVKKTYPEVKCISSPKNGGYGYGNNVGFRNSSSDYFIVMNPDVRFIRPILKDIVLKMENNKTMGMAGVSFTDGSRSCYIKPEALSTWTMTKEYILKATPKYNQRMHYLSGSFLIFRYDAYRAAGGFDESIFMYFEEADISNRIISCGYDVVLLKETEVQHLAHNREVKTQLIKFERDSLEYYCHKYGCDLKKLLSLWRAYFKLTKFISLVLNQKLRVQRAQAYIDIFCKPISEGSSSK